MDPKTKRNKFSGLIDYDYVLCFKLGYDFYVFCPYEAMLNLLFKLSKKKYFNNDKEKNAFESECEERTDIFISYWFSFLYSYAFIALSVIFMVAKERGKDVDEVIRLLKIKKLIATELFKESIMKDI